MELKLLYGRKALRLMPGFAATTSVVGWLMSASRCRCSPRRPTYPIESIDLKGSWRSTVAFIVHASGFLNALLWVVTVSGIAAPLVAGPRLSTEPLDKLTLGWKGGSPPRTIESLTPRRVR